MTMEEQVSTGKRRRCGSDDSIDAEYFALCDPLGMGIAFASRFEDTGEAADLELAIEHLESGLEQTTDASTLASLHHTLGCSYNERYILTDAVSDSDESIKNHQASLNLTPLDDPSRIDRIADKARAFYTRGLNSEERFYFDECIRLLEECLGQLGSESLLTLAQHQLLANAYQARWLQRLESIEDVDRSISLHNQILDRLSNDVSRRATLAEVAQLYLFKFDETDDVSLLETSLKHSRRALETWTDGNTKNEQRAELFRIVGKAFERRYKRLEEASDLEACIESFKSAVNALADHSPPLERFQSLIRLAEGYEARYQSAESITDLDVSIRTVEKALNLAPLTADQQSLGNRLLGSSYHGRYVRTGELSDLNQAITRYKKAWELEPHHDEQATFSLEGLAELLHLRYDKMGQEGDMKESLDSAMKALCFLQGPSNNWKRIPLLRTLVHVHMTKHKKTKALKDLEAAMKHVKDWEESLPKEDFQYSENLFAISHVYIDKAEASGSEDDYEISIRKMQTAVDCTAEDDPDRSHRLQALGWEFHNRFERLGKAEDLDAALELYHQAFKDVRALPRDQINAGNILAHWLVAARNIPAAYQVATETLPLVSHLTPRSLVVSDKQKLLKGIPGLSTLLGTVTLMAGKKPYEALQHVELARGIIINSLRDLRSNTLELQSLHPDLADELHQLRELLDSDPGSTSGFDNPRHDAGHQLDSLLERIRGLPGFDRFLLPPSEEQIRSAAVDGPIVMINVHEERCDALIVQMDRIVSIELTDLHHAQVIEYAAKDIDREILEWLWDTITSPIMKVLGYHEMPTTSPWPRVFWITTGPLSSFPIHCAGYHYSGSTRTVMDRVISTYSASVGAIIQGRQVTSRTSPRAWQSKKALLVGVQELRYAPEEISQIQKLCTEMHLNAAILEPCRSAVLDSLPECEIFHFAGHGMSHPLDPSKSSLKMSDGPLSVQDLFNIKLHDKAPFLAYLSACSTGRSEDEDLVDEGLHLIGACQMAGFRNVIGTLRRVDDGICVQVANMTYKWIKDSSLSNESVGEGLHHAIRMLRDQWVAANEQEDEMRGGMARQEANSHGRSLVQPTAAEAENGNMKEGRDIISCSDEPISWAPFVHFGS
ncbi:unnamed protein product [Clonostachys rhizophaga]|uniref:CHAT domain-containing protein n=1 Tax=Clonostachys rhizophaga TaxID=160324 RepID=A0A9N9YLQ1_9HYPO|nr:unnamed protein product [Clonostachys rhizophaga]